MKTLLIALATALSLASAPLASADVIVPANLFSGSCSVVSGCLVATDGWATDNATVYYTVTPNFGSPGVFRYQYIFGDGNLTDADGAALPKEISHLLLELSANITDANFSTVILTHSPIDDALVEEWGPQGNSNPGIPGTLHGIKFEVSGASAIFELTSTRVPVWGDFYAKDGVDGALDVTAFNWGFGNDPASGAAGALGWIPVPDTVTGVPNPTQFPVPAPATLVLLGAALIAVSIKSVRRI